MPKRWMRTANYQEIACGAQYQGMRMFSTKMLILSDNDPQEGLLGSCQQRTYRKVKRVDALPFERSIATEASADQKA